MRDNGRRLSDSSVCLAARFPPVTDFATYGITFEKETTRRREVALEKLHSFTFGVPPSLEH